jgi:hypothetical protein
MKRIAPQISASMWDFRLRLVSRALPTDERLKEAKIITSPKPCYLCGIGLDDTKHIFFECSVTQAALEKVCLATRTNIHFTPAHLLLITPSRPLLLSSIVTITFLWSVWIQRSFFCKGLSSHPKLERITNMFLDHTLENIPGLGTNSSQHGISSTTKIANFSCNSPADRAIICFTDGSSLGNPGPSGAGVYFAAPIPNAS